MTKNKNSTYEEDNQKPKTLKQHVNNQATDQVKSGVRDSISETLDVNSLRQEADSKLADTQQNLMQSSYDVLVYNVGAAIKAGADVSDIKAQMPELLKQIQE